MTNISYVRKLPEIKEYVLKFTLDGCKGVVKQQAATSYFEAVDRLTYHYKSQGHTVRNVELVRSIPYPH